MVDKDNNFKSFTRHMPKIQVAYDYDEYTDDVMASVVNSPENTKITAQALITALAGVVIDGKLNSREIEDDLVAEIAAERALNESYFLDLDEEV